MNAFFRKLRWLARRVRRETEVQEELAFHLAEEAEDRKANGLSDEQARSAARRDLGSVVRIAEDVRAAWTWPRGERIVQDLRFGLRGLRRSPAFTLTTVVTLAIGIGATSAIFSVVDGVLLKPLPFPDADRLIALVHQARAATELGASRAMYFTYREHNETFESVALWNANTASLAASLTGPAGPEEVQRLVSTHEFLPTLGVHPLLGRPFSAADDRPGSPATVILSYGYWQRRFGGADVLGTTLQSLRAIDPGFTDPEHIQTLRVSISRSTVPAFDRVTRMQHDMQDRLSELAGVQSVGFGTRLPLVGHGPTGPFSREDQPEAAPLTLVFRYTSPRFFTTLGTPLLAGRDFERTDQAGGRQVVIVSESVARRQWGSPMAALGKRLRRDAKSPWLEIVGVAGDIRHDGLEQPAPETIYMTSTDGLAPFMSRDVFFVIRSARAGTPGFLDDMQRAIWSVNGTSPLGSVQTLGEVYRRSIARTSLTLVLLAITGAMALSLGLVGIYGLIGYILTERRREIGVRLALGARPAVLKRMLVQHVLVLVIIGMALGVGGAAAVTRLMESLLFGVSVLDPVTYVLVATILLLTAALAGYLPARGVTRIDPIEALRQG